MIRRRLLLILSVVAPALLAGCSKETTDARSLCASQPELCRATGSGVCKQGEQTLIAARAEFAQSGQDRQRYEVLKAVDGLRTCIEGSSTIRISMRNDSGLGRNEILTLLEQERREHLAESQNTTDPWMLSYRWLRLGDSRAQKQLMGVVQQGLIDSPELFLALAGFYRHDNPKLAMHLANKVIHQRPADELTSKALVLLSSIQMQEERFMSAYRWAALALALGEGKVNLQRVANMGELSDTQVAAVMKEVPRDVELLQEGSYMVGAQ